ncbi:OmpA family protein [Pontibacter sp. G13]|uniref:OmpA/MotB family protein n=1 Tax=Pontibacter sp. G13 TaxID=3074898 RepID=UPI00288C41EC|nr:OmpA family protein [Pontibacter sp. G13]WNJ18816.1 OmpA family protein [Pontibacter sp. G13]
MNRIFAYSMLLIGMALTLNGCVSKKKYTEALKQGAIQDSLRQVRSQELIMAQEQIRNLTGDTASLGVDLRNMLSEYQQLQTTSSEELAMTNQELQEKVAALNAKEQELRDREARLRELNTMIRQKDSLANLLYQKVQDALTAFESDELTVSQREGNIYVSLSDDLLFGSGSIEVNPKGRSALIRVAEVLNRNPDIQVMIEGHTDDVPIKSGKIKDNWDLSVLRATTVVRILVWGGKVAPERLIPSGRSKYHPIAGNDSREGRDRNRRTEIILKPQLEALFAILDQE